MSVPRRMPTLAQQVWLLLQKDLRVEMRTGEVVATSLLFSAVLVSLFVFAGFSTRKAASEGRRACSGWRAPLWRYWW